MARQAASLPLGRLTGGINTFEDEALPDQCAEAIDVISDSGDLVRRPAFAPVGHGPYFRLPAGRCVVVHEYPLLTYTNYVDRAFTIPAARIGGSAGRLWIGCEEQFDGIDVRHISGIPSTLTGNRRLAVQYRQTSGSLALAHGVVDTTKRRGSLSDEAQAYFQPFMQDGCVFWHKSQFTNWTATTVNSLSRYWIALDIVVDALTEPSSSPTVSGLTGTGDVVISAPGIRAFVCSPVNGLFPCRIGNQAPVVIAGADQSPKRGRESGANIGYNRQIQTPVDVARVTSYEGSGVIGQVTKPAWSHAGAPTATEGTADVLTKLDQSYSWRTNILDGVVLTTGSALAGSSSSAINTSIGVSSTDRPYEHHRLRFTSGGLNGQEREIVSQASGVINVYDAFGGAPGAGDTFEIRTPPAFVQTREGGRLYEIDSNAAQTATLVTTRPYRSAYSASDNQRYVNFEVCREIPWVYPSGQHWCFCYNSASRRVLFTNGNAPILEFDGIRTRELTSLSDATNGTPGAALVQAWTAAIDEVAATLGQPKVPTFLRKNPPFGRYIVDFKGHIVIASLKDRENVIQWSAPGAYNQIWPNEYETQIRDAESSAITGMWTLGDQLVVSTLTGLFISDPPDSNGRLLFRPAGLGLGFVSHHATQRVPINGVGVLVGPTTDGVRAFTGSSPLEILDVWERVIPGGVNVRALSGAVAAVSLTDTLYFLAVPGAGSAVNNKLLVYDFTEKAWWLWSCPFGGISSIARDISENGRETILFGHNDGTISRLGAGDYDGNAQILGFAKSKPISLDGQTAAYTGMLVTLKETGTQQLSIKTFINKYPLEVQKLSFAVDAGAGVFGTSTYASTTLYGGDHEKTVRLNLRAGGTDSAGTLERGHRGQQFQYAIESSRQFRLSSAVLIATPKGQRHGT